MNDIYVLSNERVNVHANIYGCGWFFEGYSIYMCGLQYALSFCSFTFQIHLHIYPGHSTLITDDQVPITDEWYGDTTPGKIDSTEFLTGLRTLLSFHWDVKDH